MGGTQEFTPAWKRIGLTLKYAEEHAEPLPKVNGPSLNGIASRTRDADQSDGGRPPKRRKVTLEATDAPEEVSTTSANGDGAKHSERGVSTPVLKLKRVKSVAFTEDTKSDDGDTRTTIDFPAGSPGSTPGKSKPAAEDRDLGTEEGVPTKVKKMKEKRPKHKSGAKPGSQEKVNPSLQYLDQYANHRASWKFNKNRDSKIMSNALSTEVIPQSYSHALCLYVHGLPAMSGARQRLVTQCKEALISDDEQRNADAAKLMQYKHMLTELSPEPDESYHSWIEQEPRPVLLLWALGQDPLEFVKSHEKVNGAAIAKKKKKSRTMATIDLSSSEDDSSSDSSSSSESSDDEAAPSKPAPKKQANGGSSDTSSSGSDTSSSDDTDSEGGSSSGESDSGSTSDSD